MIFFISLYIFRFCHCQQIRFTFFFDLTLEHEKHKCSYFPLYINYKAKIISQNVEMDACLVNYILWL